MSWLVFAKNARFIADTLEALNKMNTTGEGVYLHIELRDDTDHSIVGKFCDEIAADAWSFESVEPE